MAEAATLARPYAKAAFMAARDEQALPDWSQALIAAAQLSALPTARDVLSSPNLSDDQRVGIFQGLGGPRIDAHWQNFVRLLAANKRLEVLPNIAEQYELLRAQFENEVDVEVTSAVPMTDAQRTSLGNALQKRFKRGVRMVSRVDASLIGGAVIRAGDLVIDGSLKASLERMASELAK